MKDGENIRLRCIKESDIWILHKWINNPDIVKFTTYFKPVSEMEQKEWFNSLPRIQNKVLFGIEVKENEELIGTCGFNDIDHISRKAQLFIKISDKSNRGKGFGNEALEALVDFGFSDLNLRRIWLQVLSDNEKAIKLYKNAGFSIEGILKEDLYIQGEYKDIILMASIRNSN